MQGGGKGNFFKCLGPAPCIPHPQSSSIATSEIESDRQAYETCFGTSLSRRKSMEPKALANLNGTLITTSPVKASRDAQTAPSTPINSGKGRRPTVLWVRTPPELRGCFDGNGDDGEDRGVDDAESEWGLSPVPATPAPEEIARYAAGISMSDDSTTVVGANGFGPDELLMRTCPPKPRTGVELAPAERSSTGEQHLMMRIMAARRKSLQFAPKIGSPLSRTWN